MLWILLGLRRDIKGVICNLPLHLYDEIYIYIYIIYLEYSIIIFKRGFEICIFPHV